MRGLIWDIPVVNTAIITGNQEKTEKSGCLYGLSGVCTNRAGLLQNLSAVGDFCSAEVAASGFVFPAGQQMGNSGSGGESV